MCAVSPARAAAPSLTGSSSSLQKSPASKTSSKRQTQQKADSLSAPLKAATVDRWVPLIPAAPPRRTSRTRSVAEIAIGVCCLHPLGNPRHLSRSPPPHVQPLQSTAFHQPFRSCGLLPILLLLLILLFSCC